MAYPGRSEADSTLGAGSCYGSLVIRRFAWASVVVGVLAGGCGTDEPSPSPPASPTPGPPGRFAYVATNLPAAPIAAFAVDAATGALRSAGVASFGHELPRAIVADTSGRFLWVIASAGGIRAFAIDRGTGALAEVSGSPFEVTHQIQAIAVDRASRYLFA